MTVSTITLTSTNGDSVVVSSADASYLADDIILDTTPQSVYDTGFTVRTMSGAFEIGGRIVGDQIPIREPILPFWLTKASRPRFQKLWGTPGNFHKVTMTWNDPASSSGPRSLILRLAKEIQYTTEDGFDAGLEGIDYHAVASTVAVNPNYEATEDASQWTNPDRRFSVVVTATGGTFPLNYGGSTASGIAYNAPIATVQADLAALPSVGAGKVTVTGSPGNYTIAFTDSVGGELTTGTSPTNPLTGPGAGVAITDLLNTGWFDVWNPTDQPLWIEWAFDPATQWIFPDYSFGQELKWNRAVGADATRMIVTPQLTQKLSVMSDPFMDTYLNADLSNAAGLFNGVEPIYMVPPYTGTATSPVLMPVQCAGPAGAQATLRQRRFWSAESGLEA